MRGNYLTESEMSRMPCPQAKLFAETREMCRRHHCPLFRQAFPTDSQWLADVARVAAEIGDKSPGKAAAAKALLMDPEAHGVERVYYCGLGGKP